MTNKEAIKLIQGIEEDGRNVTSEHLEALDLAIKALEKPNRVLYLCDGHGCDGCDEGTNEDHHCKHTSDITHARHFEAMTEPNGEIVGYYEKDEHIVAQINFDEEQQKKFSDEAAQRLRDEIERGDL